MVNGVVTSVVVELPTIGNDLYKDNVAFNTSSSSMGLDARSLNSRALPLSMT